MAGIKQENLHLLEAFVEESFNHYKPILLFKEGMMTLKDKYKNQPGVVEIQSAQDVLTQMGQIRFWDRNIAR